MSKRYTLMACFIAVCTTVFGQHIDNIDASFSYFQLPAKPLSKNIKSYQSKVIIGYEQKVNEQKKQYASDYAAAWADYDQKVKDADNKYLKDMEDYKVLLKQAEDKYAAEMEAYNKKSLASKVLDKQLLDQGKPVKNLPSPPYKETPSKPTMTKPEEMHFQKVYDPTMMASTYLKLEGFKNAKDNAVQITANMGGFEALEPEVETKQSTVYANQQMTTVTSYSYKIKYRHPISLRVDAGPDGPVFDEFVDKLNEYTEVKTNTFNSQYALDNYWSQNKASFMANLEEKAATDGMKYVQDFINSNYGYKSLKRETEVILVKDKDNNYLDYQQAYDAAMSGYNLLSSDPMKVKAKEEIKKGIDLWENALKESDPNNKKARIDEDVTIATHFNLIEAYIWMDDYTNALKHISSINTFKLKKKETKKVDALKEFLESQKTRWEANSK